MELKFDTGREYAVVLEGGGAKGAYEVGVWKALEEAGVKYNAVAGTSVGALNGAMMAMRRLDLAVELWGNITFSQVFDVDDEQMRRLYSGDFQELDLKSLLKDAAAAIKEGGLDIGPLRRLVEETVSEEKIRSSDVELFFVTYSLTEKKELDLDAKRLPDGRLADMLLASAYLPLFRRRKVDGKAYMDGSVQNLVPLNCLLEHGYRDIIVIRVYGLGIEKRVKIPPDANITTVAPGKKLGGILHFDAGQSRKDMQMGYFDAKRTLYGLAGKTFYIDRQWGEGQAYLLLKMFAENFCRKKGDVPSLREIHEEALPQLAKKLKAKEGGYDAVLLCLLEKAADKAEISPFRIRTEEELLRETCLAESGRAEIMRFFKGLKI